MVHSTLAVCGRCNLNEAKGKHPWCAECRSAYRLVHKHTREVQIAAQGYRNGWDACLARVQEMAAEGFTAQEIAGRL